MFERFTKDARAAVEQAGHEAGALGADRIESVHVLLGTIAEPSTVAARALASLGATPDRVRAAARGSALDADALAAIGISLDSVREQVEASFGAGALDSPRPATNPRQFSPDAKKLLELSLREAIRLKNRHIDTGHLLLGAVRDSDSSASRALSSLGLDADTVRQSVITAWANAPAA